MIRYIFRFIALVITIRLNPKKLKWTDTSVIKLIALPGDLDPNMHLNNGSSISIMDFGRHDLCIRAGISKYFLKEKWRPIIGSTIIRFHKPIPSFARFELHTSILCWDDKWIYFNQRTYYKGDLMGNAYLMGLFSSPDGQISPEEVAKCLNYHDESPPMPDNIKQWRKIKL